MHHLKTRHTYSGLISGYSEDKEPFVSLDVTSPRKPILNLLQYFIYYERHTFQFCFHNKLVLGLINLAKFMQCFRLYVRGYGDGRKATNLCYSKQDIISNHIQYLLFENR